MRRTIIAILFATFITGVVSNKASADVYTATPPKTTIVNTPEPTTLNADNLTDTTGSYKWEVFNRDSQTVPEFTSTEKAPQFNFIKDGLKKVELTVKNEDTITQTAVYDMVVTLSRPTISSATQKGNTVTVRGTAPANAQVLVYIFSDPILVKTQANRFGHFTAQTLAPSLTEGEDFHTAMAVAATTEAVAEPGFTDKVSKVVQAQITNQLSPGEVISQTGDRPLIVAQPIASEPKKVGFDYSSWVLYLLALLVALYFVIKHFKKTYESQKLGFGKRELAS